MREWATASGITRVRKAPLPVIELRSDRGTLRDNATRMPALPDNSISPN